MNSKNIVKAGSSDDLATIIDKIITKDASTVFLVVSEDAHIAQNVLNFQLIKRESESIEKNVVVVTDSDRVQSLASKAVLRVRSDVGNVLHSAEHAASGGSSPYTREVQDIVASSRVKGEASDVVDLRKERSQSISTETGATEKIENPEELADSPELDTEQESAREENLTRESVDDDKADVPLWKKKEDDESEPPDPVVSEDEGDDVETEEPEIDEDKLKVSTFAPKSEQEKEEEIPDYEPDARRESDVEDEPKKEEEIAENKEESESDPIERLFAPDSKKEDIKLKGKKPLAKRIPTLLFGKYKIYTISVLAGVLFLGGAGYAATSVLPKATIILNPLSVQDDISFQLAIDSNITSPNHDNGVIPAQVLTEEVKETFSFEATGSAQLEEYATGQITLYNEFSSAPQTLVANTRLVSSNGKLFRTLETVVIPGASIVDGKIDPNSVVVDVRADEPGEDFNIEPTSFSIPGFSGTDRYLLFYGRNEEAMTGGYLGVATIVTEEDMENAEREIREEYLEALAEDLRQGAPESLVMIEDSMDIVVFSEDASAGIGDPAEEFNIDVNAEARVFLVSQEHVNEAIEHYFINSTQYSSDFKLSEKRNIEYTVREMDYERGLAKISVDVDQIFNRTTDVDLLVEEIEGRDEVEVRKILSRKDELDRAQVRFWPFWVRSVPDDRERIEVEVEYLLELELGGE
ncbi:MAG: hypothetical protein WDZ39_00060 [Candidatus Spechtbacterales bacterium]